jgi:hypothetical protein
MDVIRFWISAIAAHPWLVAALLAGLGLIILLSLFRAILYIKHFGFLNYLKAALKMEGETWRLVGILLLIAMACAMVSFQWF